MPQHRVRSVCVVGLGYVGLPTAAILANSGFDVLGVDVREEVVAALRAGDVHIHEPGLRALASGAVAAGRLRAALAPEPSDAFVIAVPTPIHEEEKTADLSMVIAAAESIAPVLKRGDLVILESTSPPGTTAEILCPILERSGLKRGVDFNACYCPERVMPGDTVRELANNARVVGGVTPECARRAADLYRSFARAGIEETTAATAEMCKLMENSFRDLNVAFANELARLCEREGVDAFEAIRLANLHPRVNILRPGAGVGGHCIPVDPWFLVERHPEAKLIRTARGVNDATPRFLARAMAERLGLSKGQAVAVLGVAYRANIDDARESPALAFCEELETLGLETRRWDPLAKRFALPLSATLDDAIRGASAAALLVGHDLLLAGLDPSRFAELMAERKLFDAAAIVRDPTAWTEHGFRFAAAGRP
jgi:UDP-N-acetyl-D-mannosaminuronic acid dehydrogenase